ncbi:MAG: aminotransferase class V-fold PLP-dependent enzyme [Bacteroidia bacterium]
MSTLEEYFGRFRINVIGNELTIDTPYGENKRVLYADWTASGRNYKPIEHRMSEQIMPLVANTHTETNSTGLAMTHAYSKAREIIKEHVNASSDDVLISCGSGMTGAINKFQRILGFRVHEKYYNMLSLEDHERPIVFVTHMEHHSNQTTWLETIADVIVVPPDSEGRVSIGNFETAFKKYENRHLKIAAITSCSNVTGLMTDYHEIAKSIHKVGGYCFVDFACSAPYVEINMHPEDPDKRLDAIYFSPHKFLGGPGTSGILLFNKELYQNKVPDNPGGGTVDFTNPWGLHKFVDDIEAREDGGTPAFLQTMKIALCITLKEQMGVNNILKREEELLSIVWNRLGKIENLEILASQHKHRLGVISFFIEGLHYNVGVKMLNDKFGIQTRGGCSCAGTYGHYLLNLDSVVSGEIVNRINHGDCSTRPGWIRMSIHPTMTDSELHEILDGIVSLSENFQDWISDYKIDHLEGIIQHKDETNYLYSKMDDLLETDL